MKIDIKKLKAAIKENAEEIRATKKVHRDPHKQPPSWQTYAALANGKTRATILCSIRAHFRKVPRLHLQGFTFEKQAEFVTPYAGEFEVEPVDTEGVEPPMIASDHEWVTLADGTKTLRAQRI